MSMKVHVVDERQHPLREPYLIRIGGWSHERYLREAPDNQIWEFVRGEVIMHSPAAAEHQQVVGFLYRLIAGYLEARDAGLVLGGPAAVRVLANVTREPDLFVVAPEDMGKARGTPLELTPPLIVEVTSPSTRRMDLDEKAEEYARARVPEYWVVDLTQGELVVHRLEGESYRVHPLSDGRLDSRAVPGFWVHVEWPFEDPLPSGQACLQAILDD